MGSFVSVPCWSYCTSWVDLYLITLACLMQSVEAVIVNSLALVRYCDTVSPLDEPVLGSLLVPSSSSLGEEPHSLAATWRVGEILGERKAIPWEIKALCCPESQFVG